MNNILNEAKDRVYESEGLLELLQLRPDKMKELLPLVRQRFEEAMRLLAKVSPEVQDSVPGNADHTEATLTPEAENADDGITASENTAEIIGEEEEDALYSIDEPGDERTEDAPEANTPKAKGPDAQKQSPAFCLNDRFRFRRTIFGGSDAEFNAAMNRIASLDSYDEAEEYFYGDMGLDPEAEDVADFMGVIRNYFGS